jgi:lactoylglutathione lyase
MTDSLMGGVTFVLVAGDHTKLTTRTTAGKNTVVHRTVSRLNSKRTNSCVMLTEISSVPVLVNDAEKSAKWYSEKLGFEANVQGHWVTVKPKGSRTVIHLCEKFKDGSIPKEWEDDRPGGNTGIGFYSDDQKKTYEELKAKGVEFKKELHTEWFGTYAIFKDPDGNEFWM